MNGKGITLLFEKLLPISGAPRLCLFFFLLTFCCVRLNAQDTINSLIVEQKTFQLYQDKKWTELISYGNEAVNKGYDYFYLRMRIGIAYYEKKNYCLAESHFKKALEFNSGDELALEYLYYCYVFVGRNEDARMLSKTFGKGLSEKIGLDKQSSVGFIMLEGGTKISDSVNYYDKVKKSYSNYFNPAFYLQFGINHYGKNGVSLFHALTIFDQKSFLGTLHQKQYYLKVAVPVKNNWLISPSLHAIHISFENPLPGPPPKNQGGPPHFPPPMGVTTTSNYFVASLNIQKIVKKFTFSIGNLVSNMSGVTQYIHSGFISYAPFGNSKIVIGCTGYLHTINSYAATSNSLAPFIYLQPVNKFSLKFSYLMNQGNNIIEDNGYLVNNSSDLTKSRIGILANFFVSKKVSLYALYQLENKQESVQHFNYRYNIILAGIKIVPTKN